MKNNIILSMTVSSGLLLSVTFDAAAGCAEDVEKEREQVVGVQYKNVQNVLEEKLDKAAKLAAAGKEKKCRKVLENVKKTREERG